MAVDNTLYDREAHTWWDENSFLSILRTSVNPLRVEYFNHCMTSLGIEKEGFKILDIGCGGGYLSEEMAKMGYRVTGIDPSASSIAAARQHAAQSALSIDYRIGKAESLPFADASFEAVTCVDVLEHVDDLSKTIAEIARVLKPGGLFMFDTINRTLMSWLGIIFIAQEFPLTRFFPPWTHDWKMFIRPTELKAFLASHNLNIRFISGMTPAINPIHNVWLMAQMKLGRLSYKQYGEKTKLHLSQDDSMNYIGCAIRK